MSIDVPQTATQAIQGPPAGLQAPAMKNEKDQTKNSAVGPAYVLDPNLKPPPTKVAAGTVPFVGQSAAQTLASLPPLQAMGAAGLTELSLQHLLSQG